MAKTEVERMQVRRGGELLTFKVEITSFADCKDAIETLGEAEAVKWLNYGYSLQQKATARRNLGVR